jgi:aminoglycoside phosphotransferase (APT) family kinase protein
LSAPPPWALAHVPGLAGGEPPLAVVRLAGGSVNRVFRVDSRRGSFVLRLNGAAWLRPAVDRERELVLHRAASAAGVAPPIVDADPASEGLLITEFEQGRPWCDADYEDVAALHRLGERLQALHALPAPAVAAFDPWSIAQQYLHQIEALARAPPPERPLAQFERSCAMLRSNPLPACIAHGDLAQNNLLDGDRLWLLDWEYAQRGDAMMDVACVLAYYPGARRHGAELAAATGIQGHLTREALALRVYIYQALSWLWHLARGEPAQPP